jgi:hypothetical protein
LEVIKALSIFLSYVFHGLLCLILLAVSSVALAGGAQTLHLDMLPWTGSTLLYALLFGSLAGLVTVLLAIKGSWFRWLFFLWSIAVAFVLLKGYIFSGYRFSPGEFGPVVLLIVGSWIALLGSFARMVRRLGVRR